MAVSRLRLLVFGSLLLAVTAPSVWAQEAILLPIGKQPLVTVAIQAPLIATFAAFLDSQYSYDVVSDSRGQVLGLESREDDQGHRILQRDIPRSLKELKRGTHLLKFGSTTVIATVTTAFF